MTVRREENEDDSMGAHLEFGAYLWMPVRREENEDDSMGACAQRAGAFTKFL
jgi:hypothetical protein